MHSPLTGFRQAQRRLLTGPAEALVRSWAECSDSLVETGLLESERALLVPLANSTDASRTVEITVNAAGRATAVRSVQRGPLAFRQEADSLRCALDLGVTDFVIVERWGVSQRPPVAPMAL